MGRGHPHNRLDAGEFKQEIKKVSLQWSLYHTSFAKSKSYSHISWHFSFHNLSGRSHVYFYFCRKKPENFVFCWPHLKCIYHLQSNILWMMSYLENYFGFWLFFPIFFWFFFFFWPCLAPTILVVVSSPTYCYHFNEHMDVILISLFYNQL